MTGGPDVRSGIRGVVLDLDGTVYDDQGVIEGAVASIEALRRAGFRVGFATNTTRRPRASVVDRLHALGVEATATDVTTAPRAAVTWLLEHALTPVALHVAPETEVEFADLDRDELAPAAVVVGDLGEAWTVERLNRAFRQVMGGARLVALQKNRYWRTPAGLVLDAGPFVAALEYACAVEAPVMGKPSEPFFAAACHGLDLPRDAVLMVGDDVEVDVGGAINAGLRGALVRTGKFREVDLTRDVAPDAVLESIADVPGWLGLDARAAPSR